MSYLTDTELDSLFTSPSPTFNFTALTAELRNTIYTLYFRTHYTTSPTLRINVHGETVTPALMSTNRQIQSETRGYHSTWLRTVSLAEKSSVRIEAQVANYNISPLHHALQHLSSSRGKEDGEEEEEEEEYAALTKRLTIRHITHPTLPLLQDYIATSFTAPSLQRKHPCIQQLSTQTVHLPPFGCVALFSTSSVISLDAIMRLCFDSALSTADLVFAATQFLEQAAELEFGPRNLDAYGVVEAQEGVNVLARTVCEVVANWHLLLAEEMGEERGMKRWTKRLRQRHTDMAGVVWCFQAALRD